MSIYNELLLISISQTGDFQIPGPPPGFDKIEAIVKDDPESDMPTGDRNETYKKLEEDLINQIKVSVCDTALSSHVGMSKSQAAECKFLILY